MSGAHVVEPRAPDPVLAPYAELRETHSAVVFFVGDRAFKLKKAVNLGFLDFTTPEKRRAVCAREVSLNRRLAPDVYLGVSDVLDVDGRPMDHLVVMRRLPARRRLSHLIERGEDVTEEIRTLAHVLAAFHGRCARSATIAAAGRADAVAKRWDSNVAESLPFVGRVLDGDRMAEVQLLAQRYIGGRGPLFDDRAQRGAILDGHGDLLAEDIFCMSDGPRILDCIEFDDELRHLDRLDDIACLAMDLEHLGAPQFASLLIDRYLELAGDVAPQSLVHHYIAYRALMRAKVTCVRLDQGGLGREPAVRLLDQARRHLIDGRVQLVAVGGAPGSGKSTVASGIADALGLTLLSSDRLRKELAGVAAETPASAPYGHGIYSGSWTERTYAELMRRAATLLGMGQSVVIDATWAQQRLRDQAVRLALETSTDLLQLRCEVADAVAEDRISRRTDVSDADPLIAAAVRADFDSWPDAVALDTSGSVDETIDLAVRAVRSIQLSPNADAT